MDQGSTKILVVIVHVIAKRETENASSKSKNKKTLLGSQPDCLMNRVQAGKAQQDGVSTTFSFAQNSRGVRVGESAGSIHSHLSAARVSSGLVGT
jgi:hypothetical protein